jgi:putative N6-adenine-specific DNA methylase
VSDRIDTFTVCQPGIEPITLGELTRLGVKGRVTHGGVIASMTWSQLALAHLHLRTATRVLVRIGRFDATDFGDLAAGLRRVDWAGWLPANADVDIRVATASSKLFHTGAIEERVREVVPPGSGDAHRLSVRLDHDHVTLSLDASGTALYQRGWRTEAVDAPIRETLAAALLLWSGWDARSPLRDPCCGSGTIAIEAAMLARRMAPGRHRSFAAESWPVAAVDWDKLRLAADADVRPTGPVVRATDTDHDAVGIARRNAERAGVEIHPEVADAAELANRARPGKPGYIVSNPPYGNRVGGDLRHVYAAVGRLGAAPWHLAILAAVGSPTSAFGHDWAESLHTRNGGMPVRFLKS